MIRTTTHLDGTLGVLLNTDGLPAPRHDTRATQRQRQHRDKVSTSARQHHDKVMAPFGSCSTPMACRHDRTTGSSTGTEAAQQQKQCVTGTSEAGQYHNMTAATSRQENEDPTRHTLGTLPMPASQPASQSTMWRPVAIMTRPTFTIRPDARRLAALATQPLSPSTIPFNRLSKQTTSQPTNPQASTPTSKLSPATRGWRPVAIMTRPTSIVCSGPSEPVR